jgi:hypothetical protein
MTPIWPMRWHDVLKFRCPGLFRCFVLFGILSGGVSLKARARESVEIKTLSLNPGAYLQGELEVGGHVRLVGMGESWFVIEDGTGRLLVSAVALGAPLRCPSGSRVHLRGRLLPLSEEHGLYFAAQTLESCSHGGQHWSAQMVRWFGDDSK